MSTKRLALYYAVGLLFGAVVGHALRAHAGEPLTTTYEGQWTRTCVPAAAYVHTFTSTQASILQDADGDPVLFTLPAHVKMVCTSTAVVTPCWAQDPDATFSSPGYFAVDADSVYAAGHGRCDAVTAPEGWTGAPMGILTEQGVVLPGGRKKYCSATREPCAANGECTSGTCNVFATPRTTYLYLRSDFIWDPDTDGRPNRCTVVDCR